MLTSEQKERYTRQISIDSIGEEGQLRLSRSSALIVGVGGLGSPIATLLASAGMGRIGIVDYDTVSLSNLPRQTIYTTSDIGQPKVECARQRLSAMNPEVTIEVYNKRFDDELADELVPQYDMVIDGCDNPSTRYIIDRAARRHSKPYVYGAIKEFEGLVSVFHYAGAGGYEDLFPEEHSPKSYSPPAVMATTPAIIGAMEANEALKIAIGYGEVLSGKLLRFESVSYSLDIFDI